MITGKYIPSRGEVPKGDQEPEGYF
jgi:hypothetical protein